MEPKATQNSNMRRFVDRLPLNPKRPKQFGVLGFLEASFVPMPIEIISAPFMIAYPRRALKMAGAMWIGCLIASVLFYTLGFLLFDPVVAPALETFGVEAQFQIIHERFSMNGLFWTVLTLGLLPMPLQLVTVVAGLLKGNIVTFVVAVALARGIRYFGLAYLARAIGPRIETIISSKRFGALLLLLLAALLLVLFWVFVRPALINI